ncbi:hypothetical protein EG329_009203 [Mollisiaceae sp. DMI_Dod_QoI]|nr:hypothetical protein EG329_009203 [Helotiales sp. DMI_Dod_QoI]
MASFAKVSLFGGDHPWSPLDWTSSDDRVRGGSSYSELKCSPFSPTAVFKGSLDIETLGGAGFASQRTTGEDRSWDLSKYDGILLDTEKADGKQYTLTLKDELLPKSPNGREQSTVSWEYDFKANQEGEKVYIQWEDMKPTYRGREKKDAKPLDLKNIKRMSLMMRSFFGTQQGDFSMSIRSISAFHKHASAHACEPYHDDPNEASVSRPNEKDGKTLNVKQQSLFGWLFHLCNIS